MREDRGFDERAFTGELMIFAGARTPLGWMPCHGQTLNTMEYGVLYSLIGTTYGGDGQFTFKLPDYRGRFLLVSGQGPGLSPRSLGKFGGAETVTIRAENLPTEISWAPKAAGQSAFWDTGHLSVSGQVTTEVTTAVSSGTARVELKPNITHKTTAGSYEFSAVDFPSAVFCNNSVGSANSAVPTGGVPGVTPAAGGAMYAADAQDPMHRDMVRTTLSLGGYRTAPAYTLDVKAKARTSVTCAVDSESTTQIYITPKGEAKIPVYLPEAYSVVGANNVPLPLLPPYCALQICICVQGIMPRGQ